MADTKISEFVVTSTVNSTDIIPIVSGGDNKSVTVGVLTLNLPNVGNKGMSKNAPNRPSTPVIPLTATLVTLPASGTPYTLGNGQDGQCMVIIGLGNCSFTTLTDSYVLTTGQKLTLYYIGYINKWV